MVQKIKLALLQMEVVDDKSANIKKAKKMISSASKEGAELIILPEMFNCPYDNSRFRDYAENPSKSPTLDAMAEISRDKQIHLVAGSIPELSQGNIYNTSFFFNAKGAILGFHRKMHLFDIDVPGKIFFKESDTLTAGEKITVIESDLGKVGIGICYDIRFPELSRLMALKGADILVYPGAFNLTTGPAHWKTLLRSRAMDNQIFIAAASPARNENASYVAYGHSLICNPWGEVIKEAGSGEEIIYSTINLEDISKIRKELPVLSNRRDDVYSLSEKL